MTMWIYASLLLASGRVDKLEGLVCLRMGSVLS